MKFNDYEIDKVVPLNSVSYYDFLIEHIKKAKKTIKACIFIINPICSEDTDLKVRQLIKELGAAKKRKLDVRIIQSGASTAQIYVANYVAHQYLKLYGINARIFSAKTKDHLHSKYCLIDHNISILGSSNWSPGGFARNNEDNVAIFSKDINIALAKRFESNYKTSKPSFNLNSI